MMQSLLHSVDGEPALLWAMCTTEQVHVPHVFVSTIPFLTASCCGTRAETEALRRPESVTHAGPCIRSRNATVSSHGRGTPWLAVTWADSAEASAGQVTSPGPRPPGPGRGRTEAASHGHRRTVRTGTAPAGLACAARAAGNSVASEAAASAA